MRKRFMITRSVYFEEPREKQIPKPQYLDFQTIFNFDDFGGK